jgi:hypothetical protein
MADHTWQVRGDYVETCSCEYLCPCITTNMAARPTRGHCTLAMAFHVDRGRHGATVLDGLNFAVVGRAPGVMAEGNWSVGVIVDERATDAQQQALVGIASGQAGGPMAALGPLVGTFLGVERKPIRIQREGLRWTVSIPDVLDQALEGVPSAARADQPLAIDNTLHPASARLALARATRSVLRVFGLDWNDTSGTNNAHFAPFSWSG